MGKYWNMEKVENIDKMTLNILFMVTNTIWLPKTLVGQMTSNTLANDIYGTGRKSNKIHA